VAALMMLAPTARAQVSNSSSAVLTSDEVHAIVQSAVTAFDAETYSVAVVDRAGRILAVWEKPGANRETSEFAVSLARTGAFFSNNQAPLSSRTVRFISGAHFP